MKALKGWHLVMLVVITIVLLILSHDPRKDAFRKADQEIAAQLEKEGKAFLEEQEKSGHLDVEKLREIMMKYAAQSNELVRRYDAGLMPDGSLPKK